MTSKTKTMTLEDVRRLAKESDEAQREAATKVHRAHDKAIKAAREVRNRLKDSISTTEKRSRLAKIIEASTDRRNPSREVSTTVLMQYLNTIASKTDVGPSKHSDGTFLWATLARYAFDWTWAWNDEQRLKAVDAFVLASRGEIDTGLAQFPREWSTVVETPQLEKIAWLADPEALDTFRSEIDRLDAEHSEADEYVDALKAATPQLFVLSEDLEIEEVA